MAFIIDVDASQVKRLIQGEETEAIIKFLRENPKTTSDKVVKYLQQEKISSRLTTLGVIEKLLYLGLIKDDRKGKYFHSLSYNDDFDFRELASKLLKSDIKENLKIFERFIFGFYASKEEVKVLHDYLDEAIIEYYNAIRYPEKHPSASPQTKKKEKKGK